MFPEGEGGGASTAPRLGGEGAKCNASGVPRETFYPGDPAIPQILAPRTPLDPCFHPPEQPGARSCSVRRRAAPAAGQGGGRLRTREERSGGVIERNHHRWTWVSWVLWSVRGSSERRRDSVPKAWPLPACSCRRPGTATPSPAAPPPHAPASRHQCHHTVHPQRLKLSPLRPVLRHGEVRLGLHSARIGWPLRKPFGWRAGPASPGRRCVARAPLYTCEHAHEIKP